MRRLLKILLVFITIGAALYIGNKFYSGLDVSLKDDNLVWNLKYKGVKGAVDFTFDENNNFYIAYKDKIQFINKNGKSYDLVSDKTWNISSIEYAKNKLYISSDTRILCYDMAGNTTKEIITDLPNFGDYRESLLKVKGDDLFITIGAATNSGVVGKDNNWLRENPYNHDVSPKDITVRGKKFGQENTGAFAIYKTKNLSGQIIPGHFPGNASILRYSISGEAAETYAWGIRNVKGIDIDNDNSLIVSVGGMEDRGLRPVKGDQDYIYSIKRGNWYGWPDYSGGDPINSPKFKGTGNDRVSFILDNHPSTNPPAPIYQHKSLAALGAIAVDTAGKIGEKNCIYFYDSKDNIVYSVNKSGVLNDKIYLSKECYISSIKMSIESLILLDSENGSLYAVNNNPSKVQYGIPKSVIYYVLGLFILGISIILLKWKN